MRSFWRLLLPGVVVALSAPASADAMSANGPTVLTCTAKRSRNQGCRAVCAYVPWSAACGCTNAGTMNCASTQSTCTYSNT